MSAEEGRGAQDIAGLRTRAEQLLAHRGAAADWPLNEVQQLVQELEVHRIELEMQNDELRQAQHQLELSRDRYTDLYDFAPVGYLTVDRAGMIREVNLTAAAELSRLAVLHFREQGGGRIINIASRAAYRGDSPAHWHYAASKAGMIGMTKSITRVVRMCGSVSSRSRSCG